MQCNSVLGGFVSRVMGFCFYTFFYSIVMGISFNLYNDNLTFDKEQTSSARLCSTVMKTYEVSNVNKPDISGCDV